MSSLPQNPADQQQRREERRRGFGARLAQVRENRAIAFLVVLFVGFLALALIANSSDLLRADLQVTNRVQRLDSDPLTVLARCFTILGNGLPLALMALPAVYWFIRTKRLWAAVLTLATIAGHPLNFALKALINRPRPDASVVDVLFPAKGTSFPSGHAMTAVMFFGFLAVMCWVHIGHRHARRAWALFFVALALGVSLSRVYLGAHFLSDVVGGWAAGLFFLLLWTEAYKLLGRKELAPPPKKEPKGKGRLNRQDAEDAKVREEGEG